MSITAGLDVGGAHLKVALIEDGRPIEVAQYLCPLWQGLDKLDAALAEAQPVLARADRYAITMTGELSDLFESRQAGVETLVRYMTGALGSKINFWMGLRGFGPPDSAFAHHADVGSTNFLATASLIAKLTTDALLVDFGSTTADVIAIISGKPAPLGLTDGTRQASGELVYTGYTRTAVMAVAQNAPFKGEWVSLAREYLATMADVRRILGELDADADLHATADGRGKSIAESTARLARMLGRDFSEAKASQWQLAARHIAEIQMRSIADAMVQVLSRHPGADLSRLVTAGIGCDVANVLGHRLGLTPTTFGKITGANGRCSRAATHSAAAVAVGMLLEL